MKVHTNRSILSIYIDAGVGGKIDTFGEKSTILINKCVYHRDKESGQLH